MLGRSPEEVAKFLAKSAGLNKTMIGEYLGEREDTCIRVMHAFIDALEFAGMEFDTSIRCAQKSWAQLVALLQANINAEAAQLGGTMHLSTLVSFARVLIDCEADFEPVRCSQYLLICMMHFSGCTTRAVTAYGGVSMPLMPQMLCQNA